MSQLFRFPGSVRRDPAVEVWMREHAGALGAIAQRWCDVMRDCGDDVRELLHDGHPTACVTDAAFAYVNAFTAHVNVGFFRGAELADPDGLLEGTGKFMRHVKLLPGRDVDARALTKLIETAYTDMKGRLKAEPVMRAQDYSEIEDWPGYFGSVLGKDARETLVAALGSFAQEGVTEGVAIDLAAGEGRDTLELLTQGWRVVATDSHPDAFSYLWPRVPDALKSRLTTVVASFAETEIPHCDLVNASFALPFCEPTHFPLLWSRIVAAIRPGGRFAGQFFGKRDSWASRPGRMHHSRDEILELLRGFEIEMMNEEEKDDPPDLRNPKHWQLFHVVARKL